MIAARRSRAVAMALVLLTLPACQHQNPFSKLPPPDTLPEPENGSYADLGRALLQQGETELARAAFVRSIRVEGFNATALTGAGIAAERQGLLNDALRFFDRARLIAPDSIMAHNNLGTVYYKLGEYYAARRAFASADALANGTNEVAARNLKLAQIAINEGRAQDEQVAQTPLKVRRVGSGVYELVPATKNEADG